jgi:fumarate reductase flavoprotein subunit
MTLSISRRRLIQTVAASSVAAGSAAVPGVASAAEPGFDRSFDVLVVGGGFSGLAAAVSAAREGAKVCLIEQRAYCGGDGVLSEGIFFAYGTSIQKRDNIKNVTKERFWADQCSGIMDDDVMFNVRDNSPESPNYFTYNRHDPGVMKRIADNTPKGIRLLQDFGAEFLPIDPAKPFLHTVVRNGCSRVAQGILNDLKKRGCPVIKYLRATDLVLGKEGEVTGVEAVYVGGANKGKKVRIGAKNTILATGGFLDNEEMMKRYKLFWSGIPAGWSSVGEGLPKDHNGDGITMGRRIGASLESMESMPKFFAGGDKGVHIPSWLIFYYDTAYFLNPEGKRVENEYVAWYAGSVLSLVKRKQKYGFVLFDESVFSGPRHDYWHFDDCMKTGGLFRANSPEELAAKVGLDPKAVRETIEKINRDAEAHKDTEYGRTDHLFKPLKAPYYISAKGYPVRYKTEGGLEVNRKFQVLRSTDLKPFKGLYAVGAGCGSMTTRNNDVTTAGILAGTDAAREALGKSI